MSRMVLKSKHVDKVALAQQKLADNKAELQRKIEAGEKVKRNYDEVELDIARGHNSNIRQERSAKIHPLVVAINGVMTPVVDPNCTWAFKTPPVLMSSRDLVAHIKVRKDPSILGVVDFESWQLLAGAMHHMVSLTFNDDGVLLTDENRKDVRFHKNYDEVDAYFCSLMVELINKCAKDPEASKEGKIWAHNGSNFDFVGFALSKGVDRNTRLEREIVVKGPDGKNKKINLRYDIESFSNKAKLTICCGKGKGGEYRIHLVDSYHLLPVPVSALGDKGKTPQQYTNPLEWINSHESTITGTKFALTEEDVRPYLYVAHNRPLESFKDSGEISDVAFEGITLWKNRLDNPEYSCDDVIILANALKRWAAKFRRIAKPLAQILGQEAVDMLRPFTYNTASSAGFALSVAYWYESRLENTDGIIGLRSDLKYQQLKPVYALIVPNRDPELLSENEIAAELMAGTKIQKHGLVSHRERALIEYPVWTTKFDNRFARVAQNGSQTSVIKPICYGMMEVDSNSAFPSAMSRGSEKMTTISGYSHKGQTCGSYSSPVKINALVGFEDPGYRSGMPTSKMIDIGMATPEKMLNEYGDEVTMWVVRGRQRILHMLQARNGEFTVVLPPSRDSEIIAVPGLPIRTPGTGLDSRLVNPSITQPTILILRGEYIASYACSPTVDDDAMVIYLCEESVNQFGRESYRDRSRHGPIMGVYMDKTGRVFGKPHMPHKRFVEIVFNMRLEEKKLARKARAEGQLQLADQLDSEATITKLILNGGGYGTYAQNERPEEDFSLESIDECVGIIERICGLDPSWKGMYVGLKLLVPDYITTHETCNWEDLYSAIAIFRDRREAIDLEGSEKASQKILDLQTSAFRKLFTTWADNQITTFTTYHHETTDVDENGRKITRPRGIMTLAERTSSHAIRPYASAVVAKAAVNLHVGQLAIQRSPFGLAYSDTDSLHAETWYIKPFTNEKAIALVNAEYLATYGVEADHHQSGLQRLMRDENVDTGKLFTDILEIYGLTTGELLGQWGLESHKYTRGLVSPIMDNKPYRSHRTFYFAPKVYMDTDKHNNVARTRVRSIPKVNPVHQPALVGFVSSMRSLADRRGLHQENFRAVKLDESREVTFGNVKRDVNMLFSSTRRKYLTSTSSEPFALEYTQEMVDKINAGELISSETLAKNAMEGIGLDVDLKNIYGLEEAYMTYTAEVKIQGKSFSTISQMIIDEISQKERLIASQDLSETANPRLIFMAKGPEYEQEALDAETSELMRANKEAIQKISQHGYRDEAVEISMEIARSVALSKQGDTEAATAKARAATDQLAGIMDFVDLTDFMNGTGDYKKKEDENGDAE